MFSCLSPALPPLPSPPRLGGPKTKCARILASPASRAVSACGNLTPSAPTLADGNVVLASVSQRRRWGGGWRWGGGGGQGLKVFERHHRKTTRFPYREPGNTTKCPSPQQSGREKEIPSAPDLPDLGQFLQESSPSRRQDNLDALTGKVLWLWFRILSHQHPSSNQIQQILTGYSMLSAGGETGISNIGSPAASPPPPSAVRQAQKSMPSAILLYQNTADGEGAVTSRGPTDRVKAQWLATRRERVSQTWIFSFKST